MLLFACQEDQEINVESEPIETPDVLEDIYTVLLSQEQVTGTYDTWIESLPFIDELYYLRWNEEAIEWRIKGENTWHTLLSISDLMTYDSSKGYEIFKKFYPYYDNDVFTFIAEVESHNIINYLDVWLYFDLDGGTFSEDFDVYMKLHDLTSIPTPTKEGFVFDGWYVDNQFEEEVNDLNFDHNITFYAKWTIERYQDFINEGINIVFPEIDESLTEYVIQYIEVKYHNDITIYYIYECEVENQYGSIHFSVVIDQNHNIVELDIISKESPFKRDELKAFLDLFEESPIYSFQPKNSLTAGATTDFNSISNVLTKIGVIHEAMHNDINNIYKRWFSLGGRIEADHIFESTDMIMSKDNIYDPYQNLLGYIFTLTGSSIYEYDNMLEGSITIKVGLRTDGTIVGIYIPIDSYGHSKGGFYSLVEDYTEQYINQNVNLMSFPDEIAGATHSKTLINNMLFSLKTYF
jgi:uncharacterized repeat protein (TIGR02543 family)